MRIVRNCQAMELQSCTHDRQLEHVVNRESADGGPWAHTEKDRTAESRKLLNETRVVKFH